MELYKNILATALSNQRVKVTFENLKTESPSAIVESVSYKTLERIQRVLDNDRLEDFECIERIVRLLEAIGAGGGSRHNY